MTVPSEIHVMFDLMGSGTPQMKKYGMVNHRLRTFADPKVSRTMRIISLLAKSYIAKHGVTVPPHGTPVKVSIIMLYAAPKNRRRGKNAVGESAPCTSHQCGDCDNKAKLVIDALTAAGCWADDKDITTLLVTKRWTLGTPRIVVTIAPDFTTFEAPSPNA